RTVVEIDATTGGDTTSVAGPVPWNAILGVLGALPGTTFERLSIRISDGSQGSARGQDELDLTAAIAAQLATRHEVTLNGLPLSTMPESALPHLDVLEDERWRWSTQTTADWFAPDE